MNVGESRPWPAPAKLNLFLHILGRRADGYHELQTCFQFVDLCDEITIRARGDGRIERTAGAAGIAPEQDLSVRAALALKAAAGCALGADIGVLKRIPMGAGLGGGSSDAATCLVALNHLWKLRWTVEELAALGLEIGCRCARVRSRPRRVGRRGRGTPDAAVPAAGARRG